MASYLETSDEKLAIQVDNFSSKIGLYATDLGISSAEVEGIIKDALFFLWVVTNFKKIDTHKKNWTTFKNILKKGEANVTINNAPTEPRLDAAPEQVAPGILVRFTTLVNRVKAHQNYTTAIGQNLGIEITTSQQRDLDTAQPTLKPVIRGGVVNLVWKKGKMGGILIEKDSGNGFVTLDKDFHPDFIDNSPLPPQGQSAVWKYRAIYLNNDGKVGLWSDIVTVTVAG
jgi:hypothetical protein